MEQAKLCTVIVGPSFELAKQQIESVMGQTDLIEFRLDLFNFLDPKIIENLIAIGGLPVIFTLRNNGLRGGYEGEEASRLDLLFNLLSINPDYVDLEHDVDLHFFEHVILQFPKTKIICSYHNFLKTPIDLEGILSSIKNPFAHHYKIATFANSTIDSLRMLKLLKTSGENLTALCMGEKGEITRILAKVFGSQIAFAAADQKARSAPGQLDIETLVCTYRFHTLNAQTQVYGLIGDPVEHSIGHIAHNGVFEKFGLNAVYIKMQIQEQELVAFIDLVKELKFMGLSVTQPLKEQVVPLIDTFVLGSEKIGAINTLSFSNGQLIGCNTDGIGALDALEKQMKVDGKTVVIIGAGGTARAIAFESKKRGAEVIIFNRSQDRAKTLADEAGCKWAALSDFTKTDYDAIINTTGTFFDLPQLKERVAQDVVYTPIETEFLLKAKSLGCKVVYGIEMFNNQAVKQYSLWMPGALSEMELLDTFYPSLI